MCVPLFFLGWYNNDVNVTRSEELTYFNFNLIKKGVRWITPLRFVECSQFLTDWAPAGGNQGAVMPSSGGQIVVKERKNNTCEDTYKTANLTAHITLPK